MRRLPAKNARPSSSFSNCPTLKSPGISSGAMSPKIRARRRSAAASSNRIDFIPSRRAAFAWLAWLGMAGLLTAHSSLPWPVRLAIGALGFAFAGRALWSYVLLRGPRSVRALEWASGTPIAYHVLIGATGRRLVAVPEGCHRYG